jgi:hypothetical protein
VLFPCQGTCLLLNNLVNFSKFEGIPSWIWLLFFGAWLQLFGLFWMVTARLSSVVMLQEQPHFYDRHITVNKILNRNRFGEGNDTNQGRRYKSGTSCFFILLIFWGLFTRKDHLTHHNIFKYIYFHDSYQ